MVNLQAFVFAAFGRSFSADGMPDVLDVVGHSEPVHETHALAMQVYSIDMFTTKDNVKSLKSLIRFLNSVDCTLKRAMLRNSWQIAGLSQRNCWGRRGGR